MTISNQLWQSIQRDYETNNNVTYDRLGMIYGVHKRSIIRRAKTYNWRKGMVPEIVENNLSVVEQIEQAEKLIIEVPEYAKEIQSSMDYKLKYREQIAKNNYKNAKVQEIIIDNTSQLVEDFNPYGVDAIEDNQRLSATTKNLHTNDKEDKTNITVNTQVNIYSDMTDDDLIRERIELKERLL